MKNCTKDLDSKIKTQNRNENRKRTFFTCISYVNVLRVFVTNAAAGFRETQ